MDEITRKRLLEKNEKLIQMVIERAKRDFPDDIAVIGLSGSFSMGDFHEKSDLDLIIINNTDRGWGISRCFLLGDVGYDIYCTPWEARIRDEANLESPMVSCLTDMKILYCAKPEYFERLRSYQQKALDALAKPFGKEALERAQKCLERARQHYADTLLYEEIGQVRYASGCMLLELVNALTHLNNTYIKRGVKRYLEELLSYAHLPEGFPQTYQAVITATSIEEIRSASHTLLLSIRNLFERRKEESLPHPVPTYESLAGTYEELWCNCRNKILASVSANDPAYAFYAANSAQGFLVEMATECGTKRFNLMQHYDPRNLPRLQREFLRIMDEYLEEYRRVGRTVDRFDTFEQLYESFMRPAPGE